MSQPHPPGGIRALQAATILASTAAGVGNASLSLFVIPRLLESPTPLMLRQWKNMHALTHLIFPPPIILSGLAYFYLAYATRSRLYAVAGAFCAAATPWTWTLMMPLNRKLLARAEAVRGLEGGDVEVADAEGAKKLVDDWGTFNLPRGLSVFAAGVVGLFATLF